MSKRPPIPIKIRRAVLVEAGHRCAVCGVPCPLEHAHIIPWRIKPEHRQEDLICLCANCHGRADNEEWGEEALREYKAKPWIVRGDNQPGTKRQAEPPVRITMTVDMEFEEFDSHKANMLRHAIAGLLHIYPDQIKVVSKKKGSTKVTLVLPMSSAEELIRLLTTHNPELKRHLGLFKIEAIDVEEDVEVEYSTEEIAEPSFALSSPGSLIGTFPAPRFGSPLPQNYEFSRRVWNLAATDLRRLERQASYLSLKFRGPDAIWDSGDLIIETFITALEGERAWPREVSFFTYVSHTMKELARRQFKRDIEALKKEAHGKEFDKDVRSMISALPDPERVAVLKEEVRNLRRMFAHDEIAIHVLDGMLLGMTKVEICEHLGISRKQYDAARKRIWKALLQRP